MQYEYYYDLPNALLSSVHPSRLAFVHRRRACSGSVPGRRRRRPSTSCCAVVGGAWRATLRTFSSCRHIHSTVLIEKSQQLLRAQGGVRSVIAELLVQHPCGQTCTHTPSVEPARLCMSTCPRKHWHRRCSLAHGCWCRCGCSCMQFPRSAALLPAAADHGVCLALADARRLAAAEAASGGSGPA